MPLYDFICFKCSLVKQEVVKYGDRDTLGIVKCEKCGGDTERQFPAPGVLQASWPDGVRRPGFAALREASKLEAQLREAKWKSGISKSNLQLSKEISNLKVAAGTEVRKKKPAEDAVDLSKREVGNTGTSGVPLAIRQLDKKQEDDNE